MSIGVIEVSNISKAYNVKTEASYITLRDSVVKMWKLLPQLIQKEKKKEKFWLFRDINFQVNKGEVVGIIGVNGVGKTTLLKIISRITSPTSGRVKIRGQVAPLLEVGTGFHPELTGQENIYLNGAILGMTKNEIKRRFDKIVEFSGVKKFLKTPIKYYSSGMYVRLAFSVYAFLETDILLIDEVLAVGDIEFQKKCLKKINEMVKKSNRTILFVSHNMAAIRNICDRVIWLHKGGVAEMGDPYKITQNYLRKLSNINFNERNYLDNFQSNKFIRIRNIEVISQEGSKIIDINKPFFINIEYETLVDERIDIVIHIINEFGSIVFVSGTTEIEKDDFKKFVRGIYLAQCNVPGNFMNSGDYIIKIIVFRDKSEIVYRNDSARAFSIIDKDYNKGEWYGKRAGLVRPKLKWRVKLKSKST